MANEMGKPPFKDHWSAQVGVDVYATIGFFPADIVIRHIQQPRPLCPNLLKRSYNTSTHNPLTASSTLAVVMASSRPISPLLLLKSTALTPPRRSLLPQLRTMEMRKFASKWLTAEILIKMLKLLMGSGTKGESFILDSLPILFLL